MDACPGTLATANDIYSCLRIVASSSMRKIRCALWNLCHQLWKVLPGTLQVRSFNFSKMRKYKSHARWLPGPCKLFCQEKGWHLGSADQPGFFWNNSCTYYAVRWEYTQVYSLVQNVPAHPSVSVFWLVTYKILQCRYRGIVRAGLLGSRPYNEEVEDPACWSWVGIAQRSISRERRSFSTVIRVTVPRLRRPQ